MLKFRLILILLGTCLYGTQNSVEATRLSLLRSLTAATKEFIERSPCTRVFRSASTNASEWKWDEARQMYYKGEKLDNIRDTTQRIRVPDISNTTLVRYKLNGLGSTQSSSEPIKKNSTKPE